jgi:CRP-like cAMP-binding protein
MDIQVSNPANAKRCGIDEPKQFYASASNCELFEDMPSSDIEKVISIARCVEFVSGDVIYLVDDPITQVFLLTDGCVKKSQFSESGQEVVLRLAVPGEIISEPTLVSGEKHSSTVVAVQDSQALSWGIVNFNAALKCFPDLRRNVGRILEHRLAELSRRYWELSTKTASPRLANGLIYLADQIGETVDDHVEIKVSQETLGRMIGMNSFSVCRLLSKWRAQGFIRLRRETIEIHSVPRLLSLC